MRKMMEARRPVPTARVHRPDKPVNGKVHQIDGDLDAGSKAMSARAG
jgi:hypothetical protein